MAERATSIALHKAPPTPDAAPGDAVAVRRRVIQLSLPVFAEVVLQTLTQVVDMAMTGRCDGRTRRNRDDDIRWGLASAR